MRNLTYHQYIDNPVVREQLERQARRLRGETVQAGLRAMARTIRTAFHHTPVLKLKTA